MFNIVRKCFLDSVNMNCIVSDSAFYYPYGYCFVDRLFYVMLYIETKTPTWLVIALHLTLLTKESLLHLT